MARSSLGLHRGCTRRDRLVLSYTQGLATAYRPIDAKQRPIDAKQPHMHTAYTMDTIIAAPGMANLQSKRSWFASSFAELVDLHASRRETERVFGAPTRALLSSGALRRSAPGRRVAVTQIACYPCDVGVASRRGGGGGVGGGHVTLTGRNWIPPSPPTLPPVSRGQRRPKDPTLLTGSDLTVEACKACMYEYLR